MNPRLLDDFLSTVRAKDLGLYGVHVFQERAGELVHFWRSDDPVCLYSGAKTFTSIAVGIAFDRGLFGLEDRVLDFFPEFQAEASAGSEAMTVRNLLQMSSGKREFWFAGDEVRRENTDWARLFFTDPMAEAPGQSFYYSNACTYMLGRLVEKTSGQTLRDFLVPRLFQPLGILNPLWHSCPGGHTLAATQLHLCLAEYARLGRLFLAGGIWEGRPIVSAGYLERAVGDVFPTRGGGRPENSHGYGYQLWRSCHPGAYRADGKYGQFCIVSPQVRAVVTITAHEEHRCPEILQAVRENLWPKLA